MEELIQGFSIEKVGKSGSKFDPDKAKWFNHQYLVKKSDEDLAQLYQSMLKSKNINIDFQKVIKIVRQIKDRASFVAEFWENSNFFFERPATYDEKMFNKTWKPETTDYMKRFSRLLDQMYVFHSANIEETTKSWFESQGLPFGQFMAPLRLVLVGAGKGPHIFDIVEILGKEETMQRIDIALEKLKV
jgi:glutamyl-tRNA synthetase